MRNKFRPQMSIIVWLKNDIKQKNLKIEKKYILPNFKYSYLWKEKKHPS